MQEARKYIRKLSAKSEWVNEVTQSCPTLFDPMDCSLPGSSLHGILQARVLEWVAISFSRGSSQPRDWARVSRIPGRHFNLWATREAPHRVWFYYKRKSTYIWVDGHTCREVHGRSSEKIHYTVESSYEGVGGEHTEFFPSECLHVCNYKYTNSDK